MADESPGSTSVPDSWTFPPTQSTPRVRTRVRNNAETSTTEAAATDTATPATPAAVDTIPVLRKTKAILVLEIFPDKSGYTIRGLYSAEALVNAASRYNTNQTRALSPAEVVNVFNDRAWLKEQCIILARQTALAETDKYCNERNKPSELISFRSFPESHLNNLWYLGVIYGVTRRERTVPTSVELADRLSIGEMEPGEEEFHKEYIVSRIVYMMIDTDIPLRIKPEEWSFVN